MTEGEGEKGSFPDLSWFREEVLQKSSVTVTFVFCGGEERGGVGGAFGKLGSLHAVPPMIFSILIKKRGFCSKNFFKHVEP